MSKKVLTWVFYGAVWGLLEATLGYSLHMLALPITGLVMFPIGVYFMMQAQGATGDKMAPIKVASVAALIKLVNLPFVPLWIKAVNPAIAILFEGVFVTVLLANTSKNLSLKALGTSIGWRVSYLLYLFVLMSMGYKIRLLQSGLSGVVTYLTLDAIVNAVLVWIIVKWAPKLRLEPKPLLTGVITMAALVLTVVLS